ncbi:MAG: hypothetical protein HN337_03635 [Deltaproteobacteria bacterium]|nr:hypothetical protein [Deltaproteobacteria bacterium]
MTLASRWERLGSAYNILPALSSPSAQIAHGRALWTLNGSTGPVRQIFFGGRAHVHKAERMISGLERRLTRQLDPLLRETGLDALIDSNRSTAERAADHLYAKVRRGQVKVDEEFSRRLLSAMLFQTEPKPLHKMARILGLIAKGDLVPQLWPAIWSAIGLRTIEFGYIGNGLSLIAPFMAEYLSHPPQKLSQLAVAPKEAVIRSMKRSALLAQFSIGGDGEKRGRSMFYPIQGERYLVIKALAEGQSPSRLLRELNAQAAVSDLSNWSDLPVPVGKGDDAAGLVRFEDGNLYIAFTAPRTYYDYADDITLSKRSLMRGLTSAIHDVFLWSAHGLYHTVPARLFHVQGDAAQRRADQGRFVVFADMVFGASSGYGMGLLRNAGEALKYPNVGVSGVRDLEEVATIDDIMGNFESWRPELEQLRWQRNARTLLDFSMLSDWLFVATHLLVNWTVGQDDFQKDADSAWKQDELLEPFSESLLMLYSVAHATRFDLSVEVAMSALRKRVDWLKLARQYAFFETSASHPYLEEDVPVSIFPTQQLYGGEVIVSGKKGRNLMGPYYDSTFASSGQYRSREIERALAAVFIPPSVSW